MALCWAPAIKTDITVLGTSLGLKMDALLLIFACVWAGGPVKPQPVFKARIMACPCAVVWH